MMDRISTNQVWWLFIAIAIIWFANLEYRTLVKPDEGRYAEIPREMVASGSIGDGRAGSTARSPGDSAQIIRIPGWFIVGIFAGRSVAPSVLISFSYYNSSGIN